MHYEITADQCAAMAQIAPVMMILLIAERALVRRIGASDPRAQGVLIATFFGWFVVVFAGIAAMHPESDQAARWMVAVIALLCSAVTLGIFASALFDHPEREA